MSAVRRPRRAGADSNGERTLASGERPTPRHTARQPQRLMRSVLGPVDIAASTMAWFRRRPEVGLMFHSDRGSQYASHEFQKTLKRFAMVGSMSRKGNCWDNAVTETLFGSLKVERLLDVRFHADRLQGGLFRVNRVIPFSANHFAFLPVSPAEVSADFR